MKNSIFPASRAENGAESADEAGELRDRALPLWQLPTVAETLSFLADSLLGFLKRAGVLLVIFALLGQILLKIAPTGRILGADEIESSILAALGRVVAPLLSPLGFGSWQAAACLLAGIGSKEAALSLFSLLLGGGTEEFSARLLHSGLFSRASALAFLVFYLLYCPCFSTIAVLRGEKMPLRRLLIPLAFAFLFSLAVYGIGQACGL